MRLFEKGLRTGTGQAAVLKPSLGGGVNDAHLVAGISCQRCPGDG
jgi:hypothetical protein